jgi:hypothetical protein
VRETLCYPNGIWSHCGNSLDQTNPGQCDGPGVEGLSGPGLWVQSKFSLANYLGQRVRIRWIAQSWEFDCCASSYYELGGGWAPQPNDEGWWIDDIKVTGALVDIAQPPPDTKAPGPQTCPGAFCSSGSGDGGFTVDLVVQDSDGDGNITGGEPIVLSAAATSNPGGCVGGGVQFRFFKLGDTNSCQGGVHAGHPCSANSDCPGSTCGPTYNVVQDWSSDPTYNDVPTADSEYHVQARCSSYFICAGGSQVGQACTSNAQCPGSTCNAGCQSNFLSAAATETFAAYPGDGSDLVLSLTHAAGTTTIGWPSRRQLAQVSGYDLFKITIDTSGDPDLLTLSGLACVAGNLPQPGGAPGPVVSSTEAINPVVGKATMFLSGHNPVAVGGQAALGRRFDGLNRPLRALPTAACP